MTTPAKPLDQVVIAVLANRLDSIVREMTNTLFRTGRSAILNTAKDFSCSIVTADDQLLSSADGLPIHVLGGGRQTASMREFHQDLAPGDAFLHNDPYLGNTHTADHTILVPVFCGGTHLFTVCAKAHQADCGNSDPSTYMPFAKDVYQEGGLNFPCVRIQRDYRDVQDIIRMCQRRIRVPEVWYGDYLAALGAARIGERRLVGLVERYGAPTVANFVREWLDYSERRMAHAIGLLPAGRLSAEGRHDQLPGLPDGIPVKVSVEVKPTEGLVEVDLRDNIDCVPVGVNLSRTCATAGALIGVLNCIDPSVPRNEGSFRRIRILLRENCVVGIPRFPACTSMATSNVTNRLINATQRAFSLLGDGHGLAEGAASMGAGFGVVSGRDRRLSGADGGTERHFNAALGVDHAVRGNAEGIGRIEGGSSHEDGSKTDKRVEGGDKLRHRRHGDALRRDTADDCADGEAAHNQEPRQHAHRLRQRKGCENGNGHADHAVHVALARGGGRGKPAQRHDEERACDEIEKGCEIGAHLTSLSSCTWRACAR